ncbi:MAG: GntP family permease, partial [Planctomycetaceae bacterium]|nr:GntP family permease [Planctomycetaceae bacterium]
MTSTLLVLLVGLLTVVGGILFLRLHAFVALILAALFVGSLSSANMVLRSRLVTASTIPARLTAGQQIESDEECPVDTPLTLLVSHGLGTELKRPARVRLTSAAESAENIVSEETTAGGFRYDVTIVDGQLPVAERDSELRLATAAVLKSADELAGKAVIDRVAAALGSSCTDLAIMIVAASIIGTCLLKSGAADRVVQSSLRAVGPRGAPLGFAFSGFVLSIPVFFDTVFLLMVPLAASLYRRTGKDYLLYVLAVVTGGTMAHSLVPPTPGPLLIAAEFGVSQTAMILGGTIIGLLASIVGLTYAYWINRRCVLPLRTPDGTVEDLKISPTESADAGQPTPSLLASLLPILLPLLLITMGTGIGQQEGAWVWSIGSLSVQSPVIEFLHPFCNKNIALMLGAAAAMLVWVVVRRPSRETLGNAMRQSVISAGTIILVTAAGKAFGQMMQQTSVAELLQQLPASSPSAVVIAAFLVAVAVRTAQGSATVAMLTAAGVFGSLVTSGAAGVHPLYVALAVGCGSKPVSWMNDSGFLVITRMSGMTES